MVLERAITQARETQMSQWTGTGVHVNERRNIHHVAFRLAYLLFCTYPLWWLDGERECSFADLVAHEFNIDNLGDK